MIDIVFFKGSAYIWSAEDWLELRKTSRITGELIGCLPKLPRQEILLGLPLLLLPEEATLLLEKKIARIVHYPCMYQEPSESLKKAFEEYRERLYIEQQGCLREERSKQVTAMMDRIVEGKRRKILGIVTSKKKMRKELDSKVQESLNEIKIDREALFKEELAKLPKLERSEALVQTHTAYPWLKDEDIKIAEWNYPRTSEETIKYKTYKDLWERGYYITGGEKFGADFLVYPGDPIMFHSQYIIICREKTEEIPITELVAQCRIGCHVRKTQVYATLSDDGQHVNYQSFQWAESNVL